MPDPQPGDKICGRCDSFRATQQVIRRMKNPSSNEDAVLSHIDVDLCEKCGKIVDNAIKRACQAKK